MKTLISTALIGASLAGYSFGQACFETAAEVRPGLTKEATDKMTADLDAASKNAIAEPTADNIIWHARRQGYLGLYKDAVRTLTAGMSKYPKDARFYRHRGHRYITLRCLDSAIADLAQAAKLVKGKADEIEPDGMPNAQNIPTSTLQSNIWYHLGLAHYLKGDMKRAIDAYKEAMKVSKNNDMLAATSHWYYMALRRMEKNREAQKLLGPINGDFEVIENSDYLKLLRLYRDEVMADALLNEIGSMAETLGNASLGYGLGNWYLYNGDKEKAMDIFRRITSGNQWASFGYIAAEAELKR